MRHKKVTLWLSALLALGGCSDSPEEKPRLSAVVAECKPATVVVGQTSQCTANAMDQKGRRLEGASYSWTTSDEAVATVDAAGKAITHSAGTVTVRVSASLGGVSQQGQATLTVTPQPPRLSDVTVTCEPATVSAGRPSQCTAVGRDQYGQLFDVAGFVWTSSDESVATVGVTGRVTTFTPGTVTLRARASMDGVTYEGQSVLTVTQAQPTRHSTSITVSETWREADNPHVVQGQLVLGGANGPVLTLEPGVQVRFELDAELRVTSGALRVLGTEDAPVLMATVQSVPTPSFWRGLVFAGGELTSELNHVTVSGCGRSTGEGACIAVKSLAAPVLRHVTVRDSGGVGVDVADDGSAFGADSTALSVSGSTGVAVRIGANQADSLPKGGTFANNGSDAVEVHGKVTRTQTWPNLGIPYTANSEIAVGEFGTNPSLTISAGTMLRFGPDAALLVGWYGTGGLIVDGTAAEPVLFTANSLNPQPGHWRGLHIVFEHVAPSRVSHATIEYAGRGDGININRAANLNLYGENAEGGGTIVNDVIVRKSSGSGLFLGYGGYFGPGSARLTVRDNGGYAITAQPDSVGAIPTDITISGNSIDAVAIIEEVVRTSQAWPNLGLPYVLNGWSRVEASLTLAPGTELRFAPDAGLEIGWGTPGILIAMGTDEAPIRFVPDAVTPAKGHWNGLHFYNAEGSRLDHVVISHAGSTGGDGTGNVNVYREIGAFVTNSTLSNSSGCGITRSDGSRGGTTPVTTDFTLATYNNTFANNDGGAQCLN